MLFLSFLSRQCVLDIDFLSEEPFTGLTSHPGLCGFLYHAEASSSDRTPLVKFCFCCLHLWNTLQKVVAWAMCRYDALMSSSSNFLPSRFTASAIFDLHQANWSGAKARVPVSVFQMCTSFLVHIFLVPAYWEGPCLPQGVFGEGVIPSPVSDFGTLRYYFF